LRSNTIALASVRQGRLQGGKWTQLACFQIGLRGRELHHEWGRIHSVLFTKSETLDSCRFETKMRQKCQNAPNPILISIFPGNTPKRVEFIEFLFTKSETLDSYRCETKMRQNAPNPISISIFSGGNTIEGGNSFSFCSRKVEHWTL